MIYDTIEYYMIEHNIIECSIYPARCAGVPGQSGLRGGAPPEPGARPLEARGE